MPRSCCVPSGTVAQPKSDSNSVEVYPYVLACSYLVSCSPPFLLHDLLHLHHLFPLPLTSAGVSAGVSATSSCLCCFGSQIREKIGIM